MSSRPAIPVPNIDPTLYAWQPHSTPGLYLRGALGLETKWVHQNPQNRQLFLSSTVTFTNPLSSIHEFSSTVIDSWERLRFEFPEVVLKFSGDFIDESAIMECRVPTTKEEASDWIRRTLFVGEDPTSSAESQMRKTEVKYPVCAQINMNVQEDQIVGADFCFRVDHQLADGIGVYILAGNFFRILAKKVGREKSEQIDWSQAPGNIPEPWVRIMNSNQRTGGKEFEENVKKNAELILEYTVCFRYCSTYVMDLMCMA